MLHIKEYPLISDEIAYYHYPGGILFSYSKSNLRPIENISGNIELVKKVADNKPVPHSDCIL